MDKTKLLNIFNSAKSAMAKHSPEILTGLGIAGMLTTTVLAVKATPKALDLIEEEKERQDLYDISPLDKVKVAWKPYVPAAVTCVASTACLIGATSVNLRRNAALATAYQLSTTALNEYKEQVVETIGEKKEKVIREKIAQKKIDEHPVSKTEVIVTGSGTTLFCEPMTMRYFEFDINRMEKVINELNYRMITGGESYISLSEFYDEIGLDHTHNSDQLGWNLHRDGQIEIVWHAAMTDKGLPCLMLDYMVAPRFDFDMFGM